MKRHGFTVLELLLVLGLSAAMLTIAVPAFYRTMRGSATGNAARELMGKISAARAYAASNRTDVAIVFPRAETNVANPLKYSAYRVCEVDISGSSITFRRWIPGDNWTYLPSGVVIGAKKNGNDVADDNFRTPGTDNKSSAGNADTPAIGSVPAYFGTSGSTASITNSIVIRMDGMLYNLQPILIPLRQGTVSNGTVKLTPPHQADYLPLTVLFNGKTKLFRELVTE